MRFSVPQFIEVEDKIFGPLSLKQAIYLAGAILIAVAIFSRYGFIAAFFLAGPVVVFALALAFLKINNRPFYLVVYAAVFYTMKDKLYLWKKLPKKEVAKKVVEETETQQTGKHISQSRLKELAWSLDTQENVYTDDDERA